MVETDEKGGHDNGWMSGEYLRRISIAIDNVKRVIETFGNEYSVIIMADHGGHDRTHGSTLPEDMIVPFFFYGPAFGKGKEIDGISLLDIVPTIAKIMEIEKLNPTHEEVVEFAKEEAKYQNTDVDTFLKQAGDRVYSFLAQQKLFKFLVDNKVEL